jgi:hypothetical protein
MLRSQESRDEWGIEEVERATAWQDCYSQVTNLAIRFKKYNHNIRKGVEKYIFIHRATL